MFANVGMCLGQLLAGRRAPGGARGGEGRGGGGPRAGRGARRGGPRGADPLLFF